MKKLFFLFIILYIMLSMLVSCTNLYSASETNVAQEPRDEPVTTNMTSKFIIESESTVEITPKFEEDLQSVEDIKNYLHETFGEGYIKLYYIPDMNKQKDGVLHYCFLIDYFDILYNYQDLPSNAGINTTTHTFAWVNSDKEFPEFQEADYTQVNGAKMYSNIPDNKYPIPMRDGKLVPYDRFSPPSLYNQPMGYVYYDLSFMEVYKQQLKEAGFVDHGTVMRVESLWTYERESDGATLLVEIFSSDNGFSISMYVNYLNR